MIRSLIFTFRNTFRKGENKDFALKVYHITGIPPTNLSLYQLAVKHSSVAEDSTIHGIKDSYERLEFLGDSILGAVVAEYLFKKYPFKDEGFLTEIRSRIVNREVLNQVGKELGLLELVQYSGRFGNQSHKSLLGDVVEAVTGAIYLDKGFLAAKHFILNKIVLNSIDIDTIILQNKNFKSILLEWCQKENKKLDFVLVKEAGHRHQKVFTSKVVIDGEDFMEGVGFSKKKSEQAAAERTCTSLGLI
ncbi:MAG: ribonuclease III [Cytophagaceae bacterium]|nr:ribonuclease III [Cytophagaceae bacterium]